MAIVSIPPGDASGVYALIALIADAQASKKRLDDLVAQEKTAGEALDKFAAAQRESIAREQKIEALAASIAKREEQLISDHAKWDAAHSDREKNLAASTKNLNAVGEELAEREAKLLPREKGLDEWEAKLAALQKLVNQSLAEVEAEKKDLAALRLELEQKLEKLRSIAA